jgi:hypothetical protein
MSGSSSGAPATFGVQAKARRARCSGIFGRTWLWPLAFFSSSSGQMSRPIAQFFAHPTIQSHPYRLTQEHVRP